MTSRIKGTDSQPIGTGRSQPVERVKRSTPVASGEHTDSQPAGEVQITSTARQLNALAQVIRETPDVNVGRVEALQQSIGNGQYQINAGTIADRLLQLEGDMRAAGVQA